MAKKEELLDDSPDFITMSKDELLFFLETGMTYKQQRRKIKSRKASLKRKERNARKNRENSKKNLQREEYTIKRAYQSV